MMRRRRVSNHEDPSARLARQTRRDGSCLDRSSWKDFSPDGSRTTRTTTSRESRAPARSLPSAIACNPMRPPCALGHAFRYKLLVACCTSNRGPLITPHVADHRRFQSKAIIGLQTRLCKAECDLRSSTDVPEVQHVITIRTSGVTSLPCERTSISTGGLWLV